MAESPISIADYKAHLAKVNELTTSLENGDPKARKELLVATRSLFLSLETPMDAVTRMIWAEVSSTAIPFDPNPAVTFFPISGHDLESLPMLS